MQTLAMRVLEEAMRLFERMRQIEHGRNPALSVWLDAFGYELTPSPQPVPIRRRQI
jgi:hypothetical protein